MKITDDERFTSTVTGRGSAEDFEDRNVILSSLFFQTIFSKATDTARKGRYLEAEILLQELSEKERARPVILDLFARIRAQQGRFSEAEDLWRQASRSDPENRTFAACLLKVREIQSRPIRSLYSLPLVAGSIILLGSIILGLAIKQYFVMRESLTTEITRLVKEQNQNNLTLPVLKRKIPDLKINIPGITLQNESDEIVVKFDSGLFSHGITFKTEAKNLLTALGKELEPNIDQISVKIIGHTDNVPVLKRQNYIDNYSLGLARATTVIEHLRQTTRLPVTLFSINSVGELSPQYPNDNLVESNRNRTVEFRISVIKR